MQELCNQLDGANTLLKRALRKYLDASSAVQEFYNQAGSAGIPLELSDRVAKEFSSLASFERKLKRIKSAIGQVRNHYYPVVPIHSLPPEILSRVFSFVVGSRPCGVGEHSGETIKFPKYPDVLTYVCSRWRQIALNQRNLWSHIDIVPFRNLSRGFHDRAKVAAARANLLDIHYYEPSFSRDYEENLTYRLFKRIGPQIRSLELVAPTTSEYFCLDDVLTHCLEHCVAGVFDRLTIVNPGSDAPVFWLARDPDDSDDSESDDLPASHCWLMISPDDLEEILLPLTVLRLDGVYFPWDCAAYHNLAELHLLSSHAPETNGSITDFELMNMLTHSPRLQMLHFDLPIRAELPDGVPVCPVHLEQLRTLNLTPRDPSMVGLVLRLIAPGRNDLRLSMRLKAANLQVYDEHTMKFFERSNVEILRIKVVHGDTQSHILNIALFIDEVIHPLHRLRVLVLHGLFLLHGNGLGPILGRRSTGPLPQLCAVYMIHCSVDVSLLQHMIQKYSPKTLTIWNTLARNNTTYLSTQELKAAFLSESCQLVSVGGDRPNPVQYWD